MSPIKDLSLTYEALNEENTVSQGDTITGAVSFTLTKQTKVKLLLVKAKGDARVDWSEGTGDDRRSYSAHRRYFKVKEYVFAENAKVGTVLPQGTHCFRFRLQIPQGDMPASFKGLHGKIVYVLEAKLSRSWRLPSVLQTELNFVSKSFSRYGQALCPLSGLVDKKVGVLSKGQVKMSATVDREVYCPGDTVSVVAQICNSSSKTMKPKFSLQQNVEFRASGSSNLCSKNLCKIVGDIIPPNSEETISCQVKIPFDVTPTLHDCEIISVDCYLKVYLDISFAVDPEVAFRLIIVPSSHAALLPGDAVGPFPAGAVGGPSYSDFPPPAFPIAPYPVPTGPGPYGYPAPDPNSHANMTSGYNTQWPQQAPPYGFPPAAVWSSSVQPQAPTAPPLFQQETEPPTYTSLFPPSRGTGSNQKS
ncbi:arrestin domain-containing protein 3-like [Pempheris klunzingeri]|uniref:arrestin domain-containing protein 3-like n=1 Tax=Pempheris klunzingeri TaxID=3127111 RepID=UPI00397F90FC